MIADEEEKCVLSAELGRAMDGVGIAEGLGLFDEAEPLRVRAGGGAIGRGVARRDDNADLLDARRGGFPR